LVSEGRWQGKEKRRAEAGRKQPSACQLGEITTEGEPEGAQAQVAQMLRLDPDFIAAGTFRRMTTYWRPEDAAHIADGLRKAGLPVA
jgi:hypothetical protein